MSPFRVLCLLLCSSALVAAAPEAFEVSPSEKDQLPGGKEADGIIGDFILRNDKVEAVISGNLPLRRANMSTFYGPTGTTPGCLYDLTLRGARNDQITIFAPTSQQGNVSWVRVLKDGSDGEAVIETAITSAVGDGIRRRHEYRLRDGWQGVSITTSLRNEARQVRKVTTADRWTTFKRVGTALGIQWADAIDPADHAGYAVGATDDVRLPASGKALEMQPGEEIAFTRFLAVGKSSLEAFGQVAAQRGKVGTVQITTREKAEAPGGRVELAVRSAGETGRTVGVAQLKAQGNAKFTLPLGSYEFTFHEPGRETSTRMVAINAGGEHAVDVELSAASGIRFNIRDESGRSIPCKAQFHALDEGEWPYLGPDNRAHGCDDQYHSEKGQFRVSLRPGKFRVVVTRGIEYSHLSQEVTVKAGGVATVSGTLKRLVNTSGWVSADYHNHSTPSGDNTCGTDDRVINLAAEHIEFAPTTEHNRLYDWRPHIERLGLTDFLQTVPGLELTGPGPHLNSFPFEPEPFLQDNGAPVWNKDPRINAVTLRDWQGTEPGRWIQINHPDMVHNFIDRDADGRVDGGFTGLAQLIDGIETQNYSGSGLLDLRPFGIRKDRLGKETVYHAREFVWLQMLNRGHRYAAMAVSDAHSVWGNGVGGWRMYMPSKSDEPSEIDWRENSQHAKAGHSILTTGPFLSVRAPGGAGPGDTVRAGDKIELHVQVQCTDWIDIDRVQVLVNGRAHPEYNFTRKSHPEWFARGVMKFDRLLAIELSEDSHVIVVATGENSDLAIGYGTSGQAKLKPFAYHNPIFVDVDGGGFTPNGDTLGWPLPVKKISVAEAKRMLEERARSTNADQREL